MSDPFWPQSYSQHVSDRRNANICVCNHDQIKYFKIKKSNTSLTMEATIWLPAGPFQQQLYVM